MTGDDIDFVGFDHAVQNNLGDTGNETFAQMRRHALHIILVQAQLPGNLAVGQVQAHEIKTQNPDPKRLVMSCQNRPGQVVEPCASRLAQVALPMVLSIVVAMTDHGRPGTGRTTDAIRPSMLPNQLVTLGVVDQSGNIDQCRREHERRSGSVRDPRHRINQTT